MQNLNEYLQVETWLKAINTDLTLINGVCNFEENNLDIKIGLSVDNRSNLISFCSPLINVDRENKSLLMERALLANANGAKMEGCWLSLIGNDLVLCHSRNMASLDQVGFVNLVDNYISKSYSLKQEFSSSIASSETLPANQTPLCQASCRFYSLR
ncbi:CesT family type III secretion system chaperone [Spartinivicinus ruber]|uniref:CesT family type III secretion system chaperone n=1 Tax=Spartinivicinus ruber TaxID=2683272 RepID=UPI0013D1AA26|nr:CesT family type III secretion system chaperone [Spartinivicinus ruber]